VAREHIGIDRGLVGVDAGADECLPRRRDPLSE
jgi:hypothetical protein